jgi:Txe/YoeB family toxin of Txe-Axe toxin-antitoxin module
LEEIVQKQVQIPLLDELKKLCMTFEEAVEEKKEVSEADRKRFVRLVNFFVRTEAIKPSKSSELIERAEKAGKALDPSFAPLFSQKPEDLREKMLESFSRFVNERVNSLMGSADNK